MATSRYHKLPENTFRAKCYFDLNGTRRLGHILSTNRKTVWVQVMDGARTSFRIKRHKNKHHVKFISLCGNAR